MPRLAQMIPQIFNKYPELIPFTKRYKENSINDSVPNKKWEGKKQIFVINNAGLLKKKKLILAWFWWNS